MSLDGFITDSLREERKYFFAKSRFEKYKKDFYKYNEKRTKVINYEKNEFNSPIIDKVKKAIKNKEDYNYYNEFKVNYIMIDDKNQSQSYAVVELDYDNLVMVNLENMEMHEISEYFCEADKILGELESGKKLVYMSLDVHYSIWQDVQYYYPNRIHHKDGLKIYLQYCEDNQIDMKVLNEVIDADKIKKNLCDFVNSQEESLEI